MRDRIYNIVKHSAGRLRRELPENSRLLIFFFEPFSGELQVCWPLNGVPEVSPHLFTLVHDCFTRQSDLMVEDSKLAQFFEADPPKDIGSAVCVPLLDPDEAAMGVVYVDHPEKNVVGIDEKMALRTFVSNQKMRIPRWTFAKDVPDVVETPSGANPTVMLVALVAMLVMGYTVFLRPGRSDGSGSVVQAVESSPADSARTFRALLVRKDVSMARKKLTPELRGRWKEQAMLQWITSHGNGWGFEGREVEVVSINGNTARVRLNPRFSQGESKDSPIMEFDLVKDQAEWLVSGILDAGRNVTDTP